ncbi:Transcriptional regulator, contains XRE-family HTH domain [Rhizobium multihospitium]|uniref:Transcriptional regulator, contains XRE-family HTH domain n=2 Tax=Rhizobium multihospitium TaxID=410764 RepID=A0A1C3XBI5_9HYPH|nr:Transcriptional regulator, contains XRE-family HTH domain [Rhizobium multihospitium]
MGTAKMSGISGGRHKSRKRTAPLSDSHIHPVDQYVGRQIRILRIQLNLSQGDLGRGIGVSLQQVQKYEAGKNRVSASMLYEIASCMQAPVARFFKDLPHPGTGELFHLSSEADERIAYISTAEGRRLIEDVLLLPPRVRSRILSLVSILAEEQHL